MSTTHHKKWFLWDILDSACFKSHYIVCIFQHTEPASPKVQEDIVCQADCKWEELNHVSGQILHPPSFSVRGAHFNFYRQLIRLVLISCSVHRRTQKSMRKIEYQKHFENALYMTNWLYNKTNGGDAVEHEQLTTLIFTKKLGFALFSIKCHCFIVFEVYCALISNHWALKLVLILFLQHFIT